MHRARHLIIISVASKFVLNYLTILHRCSPQIVYIFAGTQSSSEEIDFITDLTPGNPNNPGKAADPLARPGLPPPNNPSPGLLSNAFVKPVKF